MKASELIMKLAEIISNDRDREVNIKFFVSQKELNGEDSVEIEEGIEKVEVEGYSKDNSIIISNIPF